MRSSAKVTMEKSTANAATTDTGTEVAHHDALPASSRCCPVSGIELWLCEYGSRVLWELARGS